MSKLEQYINDYYEGDTFWFVDECSDSWHINRINKTLDLMEYLDGKHAILKRPNEVWKGRTFKTRKIVLQYVKPILTFQHSFLLKNPITLTSDDTETLEVYKEAYKRGKYNDIDVKVLDNLLKYGEIYEYIFVDNDKKIKSYLIKSCDAYPVYNDKMEYIALIEHYISNGVSYYTVYSENKVEEYNDKGGQLHKVAEYNNLSGLPIRYLLPSESDELFPRSDMEDWINIIDQMEDLLSKYMDSFYKFLNPLPIMTGTKLSTGKNGEGAINPNIAGQVLQLDHTSTFQYAIAKMDYNSFDKLYKTLHQALLNISMTPSIAMNSAEISNLSETSMKILFYMAIARAGITSKHLYEGMDQRWKQMKGLLEMLNNRTYKGYINGTFKMDIPANNSETVDNLIKLYNAGTISLETLLSYSPYCYNVTEEINKLEQGNSVNKVNK